MEDRYNPNFLEEELHKPSVFINENLLSIDYVPKHLPHRENELREISRHFKIQIERPGEVSRRLILTGPVGSGKTSITKKFGQIGTIPSYPFAHFFAKHHPLITTHPIPKELLLADLLIV